MKVTVAYIVHIEDQREPSIPMMIEWELSDDPTKDELFEHARCLFLEVCGDEDEEGEEPITSVLEHGGGVLHVTDEYDLHLYITLPSRVGHLVS